MWPMGAMGIMWLAAELSLFFCFFYNTQWLDSAEKEDAKR